VRRRPPRSTEDVTPRFRVSIHPTPVASGPSRILAYGYLRNDPVMRPREERTVARASASVRVGRKLVLVIALVSIACLLAPQVAAAHRSEEHTSELQSRVDLVC